VPSPLDDTQEAADFRREPWRIAVLIIFVLLVIGAILIYVL
jgi:hypothetical protein